VHTGSARGIVCHVLNLSVKWLVVVMCTAMAVKQDVLDGTNIACRKLSILPLLICAMELIIAHTSWKCRN
jgi:hypothetical protein